MRGEGVVENWVKSTQRTLSSDGVVENRSLRAGRLNLNVDFQNKKDRPGVLSLNPCSVCVTHVYDCLDLLAGLGAHQYFKW